MTNIFQKHIYEAQKLRTIFFLFFFKFHCLWIRSDPGFLVKLYFQTTLVLFQSYGKDFCNDMYCVPPKKSYCWKFIFVEKHHNTIGRKAAVTKILRTNISIFYTYFKSICFHRVHGWCLKDFNNNKIKQITIFQLVFQCINQIAVLTCFLSSINDSVEFNCIGNITQVVDGVHIFASKHIWYHSICPQIRILYLNITCTTPTFVLLKYVWKVTFKHGEFHIQAIRH